MYTKKYKVRNYPHARLTVKFMFVVTIVLLFAFVAYQGILIGFEFLLDVFDMLT